MHLIRGAASLRPGLLGFQRLTTVANSINAKGLPLLRGTSFGGERDSNVITRLHRERKHLRRRTDRVIARRRPVFDYKVLMP